MILKTVFEDGQVIFEDLSDKFILTSKQRCPGKFEQTFDSYFGSDVPARDVFKSNCFAIISPMRMEQFDIPLYTPYRYSLLSDRGSEIMPIHIGGL